VLPANNNCYKEAGMIKNMLARAITFVRDRCWAAQAFFRGKVLRQQAYRPKGNLFRAPPGGVSVMRMRILIKWWGLRPMTVEEMLTLKEQATKILQKAEAGYEPTPVHGTRYDHIIPYPHWDGEKWGLTYPEDDNLRFIFRG
jgi:hypothetical protein